MSGVSPASAKRFRVAFSFAGETRGFVAALASLLAEEFGKKKILYDKFHESEFARRDLGIYLPELYHKESDLVVIVLSSAYDEKQWTGLEWTAIHDLLSQRKHDEVILCRFDRATVTGLYSTVGFIELDGRKPEEIRDLILERLTLIDERREVAEAPSVSSTDGSAKTSIPHNLPTLQPFFGREDELKKIADALDPDSRTWGALIDGPGGMGKTSLAVRAAYDASPEVFKKIIFISLKTRELDDDGLRDLSGFILSGLVELLNELARELGRDDILKLAENERLRPLLDALRGTQTLLVLDNLESLRKPERDTLFTFVKKLPAGCKAILTSRGRIGSGAEELILEALSEKASLDTLAELATHNPLLAQTSGAERLVLYRETAGKPLLLRWTAGQIGRGHCLTFTDAPHFIRSCPEGNDPLEFIFGDLVEDFHDHETKALCALTYFTLPAIVEHVAAIAGVDAAIAERGAHAPSRAVSGALAGNIRPTDEDADLSGERDATWVPDPSSARAPKTAREGACAPLSVETALKSLVNRSLVVPTDEFQSFTLVPMVADFLRKKKPEVMAETGDRLEKRAYALIIENGYENHDRFPALEAAWPGIAPALPLFLNGDNARLQTVCNALQNFLHFQGRWDEWLALCEIAEVRAIAAADYHKAGWRAYNIGCSHHLRQRAKAVIACAERAATHWGSAEVGARELSLSIGLRGKGHLSEEDYPSAIAAFRQALELLQSFGSESKDMVAVLNDLGSAEYNANKLEASAEWFREALRVANVCGDAEGVAISMGNLTELALCREDWPSTETLARKALTAAVAVHRQELIASGNDRLALTLMRQSKVSEARTHALRAVEICSQLGSSNLAFAQATLAECEG